MNQKVSTGLGTAVLLVMAFTAGYFVWIIEKDNSQEPMYYQVASTEKIIQDSQKKDVNPATEEVGLLSYTSSEFGFKFTYPEKHQGEGVCFYKPYIDTLTQITYIDISMSCPQSSDMQSGTFSFNTVSGIVITPWEGSLLDFVTAKQKEITPATDFVLEGPVDIYGKQAYALRCPEDESVVGEMPSICSDRWFLENAGSVFELTHNAEPLLKSIEFLR